MKKAISLSVAGALLTAATCLADMNDYEPNGWESVVLCGTGDAIAGAQLDWGASGKLYLSIDSEDDQQAPEIFYTDTGFDAATALQQIRSGSSVSLALRSDPSFDFGGETSHAAFLQIQAHSDQSFARNSTLAVDSGVISLFCNLKTSE